MCIIIKNQYEWRKQFNPIAHCTLYFIIWLICKSCYFDLQLKEDYADSAWWDLFSHNRDCSSLLYLSKHYNVHGPINLWLANSTQCTLRWSRTLQDSAPWAWYHDKNSKHWWYDSKQSGNLRKRSLCPEDSYWWRITTRQIHLSRWLSRVVSKVKLGMADSNEWLHVS